MLIELVMLNALLTQHFISLTIILHFIRIPRGSIDDINVDYNNQLELGTWTIVNFER